jgi:hypothetical protein
VPKVNRGSICARPIHLALNFSLPSNFALANPTKFLCPPQSRSMENLSRHPVLSPRVMLLYLLLIKCVWPNMSLLSRFLTSRAHLMQRGIPPYFLPLSKKTVHCIFSVLSLVFCHVGQLYCRITAPPRLTLSTLVAHKAEFFPLFSGPSLSTTSSNYRFHSFTLALAILTT